MNVEHVEYLVAGSIRKAFNMRKIIKSGTIEINLIKLKEIAGRERDKIDIKALLKIKELKNEK